MPFAATTIDLPAHTAEVRAADLDGDGRKELIFVSSEPKGRQPDALSLTIVSLSPEGQQVQRETLRLGQRATLWDAHNGLWAVDGDGAFNLRTAGRIGARRTALGGLGLTTPIAADIATDIDGDGLAEVVVVGGGKIELFGADGLSRGAVPARAEGSLRANDRGGGLQIAAAAAWPGMSFGDWDGDGVQELLLPDGDSLEVVRFGASGATSAKFKLPMDVEPRRDPAADPKAGRRDIENVWLRDVNNDGKVDLVVHQWVIGATFFGATAELVVAKGNGAGFDKPTTIATTSAAVDVQLRDIDNDGDLDILASQVDLSISNLGRALVSRKVQVELCAYIWGSGGYASQAKVIRRTNLSISEPDRLKLKIEADLNGDGWIDLVTNDGEDQLAAFAGGPAGISEAPMAVWPGALPLGPDPIFIDELTGDARAEVLLWGPKATKATLLRLR